MALPGLLCSHITRPSEHIILNMYEHTRTPPFGEQVFLFFRTRNLLVNLNKTRAVCGDSFAGKWPNEKCLRKHNHSSMTQITLGAQCRRLTGIVVVLASFLWANLLGREVRATTGKGLIVIEWIVFNVLAKILWAWFYSGFYWLNINFGPFEIRHISKEFN